MPSGFVYQLPRSNRSRTTARVGLKMFYEPEVFAAMASCFVHPNVYDREDIFRRPVRYCSRAPNAFGATVGELATGAVALHSAQTL